MAFKDLERVLYNDSIKLDYKDKLHRYYARERVNWELPTEDPKAWSKIIYPKGTTTLLGDTLEKKGLMQWPKNVALRELFGFYGEFTGDNGNKVPAGFSKDVGTMWSSKEKDSFDGQQRIHPLVQKDLLPYLQSANTAWQRKQKKGADIGNVVHDSIEHYIRQNPNNEDMPEFNETFDIAEQYLWNIKEEEYESDAMRDKALTEFDSDVAQATLAFEQFKKWWDEERPTLVGAEDLVYSKEHNVAGTFDALIRINGKLVICDWKTSSAYGDAPEGVSYDYFIQSAIYAMAYMEMGGEQIDDSCIVSARKDGGFGLVFASELGLSMYDLLDWAKSVIICYGLADKTKKALKEHAKPKEVK